MAINSREYYEFGILELGKDPWLTAVGPKLDMNKVAKQ
jgi:hypothetical protein